MANLDYKTILTQILKASKEHNGHLQTEFTMSSPDMNMVTSIVSLLEEIFADDPGVAQETIVVAEIFADGNMSFYQKDYWKDGSRAPNHRDRLLLGINI